MIDYIEALKRFVHLEQDTQNKEILNLWAEPIRKRVSEGEAIENVEVLAVQGLRLQLGCPENISKFRRGDQLRLHRGNPTAPGYFICSLEQDEQTRLVVQMSKYNTPLPPRLGPGWILDRDMVDVRHMLLGALETLAFQPERARYVKDLLDGEVHPQIHPQRRATAEQLAAGKRLNASQREAFINAYATNNYYLVQGPPGTGKTWVLAYLAAALAASGERVLVTAFTHRAINNALRKIAQATGWKRLFKVGQEDNADDLVAEGVSVRNYEHFDDSGYSAEQQGLIIGGTCFAVRTSRLQKVNFDTVIFDEASQVTLPVAIAGMLAGQRYIFIGDHQQMPPVVVAEHREEWISRSIFETLFVHHPGTMLDTTYRMCKEINDYPSRRFYNQRLVCAPQVAAQRLQLARTPSQFAEILDPAHPDVFVQLNHTDSGIRSTEEAEIIAQLILEAQRCGVHLNQMAVIAPYRAQCRLIRWSLRKHAGSIPQKEMDQLIVDTVERIQGQERDLVIISLTTSDPAHAAQRADFFFKPNRLNVAITRPRVKRILVGSPLLFKAPVQDATLRDWIENFRALYEQCHVVDGDRNSPSATTAQMSASVLQPSTPVTTPASQATEIPPKATATTAPKPLAPTPHQTSKPSEPKQVHSNSEKKGVVGMDICPVCRCKVSENRMQKHIRRVHPDWDPSQSSYHQDIQSPAVKPDHEFSRSISPNVDAELVQIAQLIGVKKLKQAELFCRDVQNEFKFTPSKSLILSGLKELSLLDRTRMKVVEWIARRSGNTFQRISPAETSRSSKISDNSSSGSKKTSSESKISTSSSNRSAYSGSDDNKEAFSPILRHDPRDYQPNLPKCPHGVIKGFTCGICEPEKFRKETGID